jgi:hypothetical protein
MSRFSIEALMGEEAWANMPSEDLALTPKEWWGSTALLGFDPGLLTYFCSVPQRGEGTIWWFGTDYQELPVVEMLEAALGAIFGCDVTFLESQKEKMRAEQKRCFEAAGRRPILKLDRAIHWSEMPIDYLSSRLNAC